MTIKRKYSSPGKELQYNPLFNPFLYTIPDSLLGVEKVQDHCYEKESFPRKLVLLPSHIVFHSRKWRCRSCQPLRVLMRQRRERERNKIEKSPSVISSVHVFGKPSQKRGRVREPNNSKGKRERESQEGQIIIMSQSFLFEGSEIETRFCLFDPDKRKWENRVKYGVLLCSVRR